MADECCCLVCVRTQEVGVVEDLGQFKELLDPGLHCIVYPLQTIVGRMSLRIQQLDVLCETKTKDNVGRIISRCLLVCFVVDRVREGSAMNMLLFETRCYDSCEFPILHPWPFLTFYILLLAPVRVSNPIQPQVFVQVGVAVQYRVLVNGAYDAYYRLTDPRNQIQSYVFDVVRSTVPRMDLDEAFVSKDEVADAVLMQLRDVMKEYGYEIKKTLITDLSPDNRVKASMNEINASRRLKEGN
jgi:regulator of protease activity HflC (stomatin/prohibitin superfamily)